jgi:hypothetical protein
VGYASRVAAERAALAGADAAVEGDRATVTGGGSTLASLQRIGGAWKVVLEDALATDEGVAALEAEADASRRAAERVVPAIRGGLYDSADDALEAFRNELSTAGVGEEPDLPPGEGGEGPTADPVPGPVQL